MAKKSKRPTLEELRAQIPQVVKENKAELIEEAYPCPDCGGLYEHPSDAADCCAYDIQEVYVCKLCDPEGKRSKEGDKHVFRYEDEAEAHLQEHHDTEESDPVAEYWDALRWGTKDPLEALSDLEMAQTRARFARM